jgi:hypothetical protein
VVAYLVELIAGADGAKLPSTPAAATDIARYLHTGGTTGTPKLAARTHANEVSNAWMMRASNVLDENSVILAALPLFHNARDDPHSQRAVDPLPAGEGRRPTAQRMPSDARTSSGEDVTSASC